ncbi:ion transporter [Terasakiispira papahanaumokuakeensis]|uniref:Ion transporter n=1 Tax=Terasakiispira papahanaumokuakeensis TaxID=197479 RepID=A0A1E2V684_9GAMM|nr:ion transporter [Terasakiispira papahanaumokuakeensis]ODC02362.1 ion transporter [Terasakiispira papahanaumokuakeensis]
MPSRRERIYDIIFEADTPLGKAFDVVLIISILLSVLAVMLDSVPALHARWGAFFYFLEWLFTVLFTVEYLVRLWCIGKPWAYARSFYGIVDLLGVLPAYISLLLAGSQYMLVIRLLRVLRVFRVLRLMRYVGEAQALTEAMRASRRKITVFLFTVATLVVIFGSLMFLIESPEAGFTSIPRSVYWAVVTLTTVGYGDISPLTPLGQAVSSVVMILGYAIIAVPTGIVTVELSRSMRYQTGRVCPGCGKEGHDDNARFCKFCGAELDPGHPSGE